MAEERDISEEAGRIAVIARRLTGLHAIVMLVDPVEHHIFSGATLDPEAVLEVLSESLVDLDKQLGTGKVLLINKVDGHLN